METPKKRSKLTYKGRFLWDNIKNYKTKKPGLWPGDCLKFFNDNYTRVSRQTVHVLW